MGYINDNVFKRWHLDCFINKKFIVGISSVAIIILIFGGYFLLGNNSLKQTIYSGEVSNLVLPIEELPKGYQIAERTPRLESDVSDFGKNLGWKEGYYIKYLKGNEDSIFDISRIDLYISRYSLENVSEGIGTVYEFEGYTNETLPNPNLGEGSMATRYTEEEFGLREYIIEFYKKDIFITLINEGTTTDYELLKDLAKKVEKRI